MRKSLRAKISLCVSVMVMVVILTSITVISSVVRTDMVEKEQQCLKAEADYYAETLNVWMVKATMVVQSMATSISTLPAYTDETVPYVLKAAFEGRAELLDMYFGTNEGGFWKASSASSIPEGYDARERGWYKAAVSNKNIVITDPYYDVFTSQMCDTIACPVVKNGEIIGVIGIDISVDTVSKIVGDINYDDGVYSFVVDASGNFIQHPNEEYMPAENKATSATSVMDELQSNLKNPDTKDIVELEDYNGTEVYIATSQIGETGWAIGIAIPTENALDTVAEINKIILIIGVVAIAIVTVVSFVWIGFMVGPVKKMKDVSVKLVEGDLEVKVEQSNTKDEIGVLQNSMYELTHGISKMIREANSILGEMAAYNLGVDDMEKYPGEFNDLSESVNSIKDILNNLILMVQESASEVHTSARQLSMAADSLAASTTSEAMSIENLQRNVGSITEKINNSSDNCKHVDIKLNELNKEIYNGNEEMKELYSAVSEVETMSNDIHKIVTAIDSIAFQTNILALNASVEAARAGDSGKGFAVVAEEVRDLAGKCAEESNKTAELIERCLAAINKAKGHADSASSCLDSVVNNSTEIAKAFSDISDATAEQAESSNSISDEIKRISDVVSSNTATAEQTSASAEELTGQAEKLNRMVRDFKTR